MKNDFLITSNFKNFNGKLSQGEVAKLGKSTQDTYNQEGWLIL